MASFPLPPDEEDRLAVLRSLKVLDTESEERFDRIVRLLARLLDVPTALVCLIDADRQWFKARVGFEPRETTRGVSFCTHAILGEGILEVANALEDPRFASNPLVLEEPRIRFYAGKPIRAPSGQRVGTLCAIDSRPRELDSEQRLILTDLAALVERELCVEEVLALQGRLEESEERFRALAGATTEGIYICRDGAIVGANPSLERMFGYRKAELIGMRSADLLLAADREPVLEKILEGNGQRCESIGRRKDGSTFPIEILGKESTFRGERARFIVLRDLSEQKRVERMKDDFVSTVSHELRTPLSSILGTLGLVLGRTAGVLPERATELLEVAQNNSFRLVHLIDDLLDMQKVEAGRMDFAFAHYDLVEIVHRAARETQAYADQYGITFSFRPDAEEIRVIVDQGRLIQVIANLLSNAAKFSPEGETVRIRAKVNGERVEVRVTDRGPGIPVDFHGSIFRKFAQASPAEVRRRGGTGLGLSISKAIIERMSGEIGFETAEGKGSTFYFRLPLDQTERLWA